MRATIVHARAAELPHRVVDLVRHRRVQPVGLDVVNHADDLALDVGVAPAHQRLAERRFAGEDMRVANDSLTMQTLGAPSRSSARERPSFGEGDPHQPEIVLADDREARRAAAAAAAESAARRRCTARAD